VAVVKEDVFLNMN